MTLDPIRDNPQHYARRTLSEVGEAMMIYAELRRFMEDLGISDPTYREVTDLGKKLYIAGSLHVRPSRTCCWMALELLTRIGHDPDIPAAVIDYLADDLMPPALSKTK